MLLTIAHLSDGSRQFLAAMAQDDGLSRTADIAVRLGVSSGYASVYRRRLRRSGMVSPAGTGRLDFAINAARQRIRSLDEYPLLCETLKPTNRGPVAFALV